MIKTFISHLNYQSIFFLNKKLHKNIDQMELWHIPYSLIFEKYLF